MTDLLGKTQGALLSVGFVLTLYAASSSVHAVLSGFNESALLDQKATLADPHLVHVFVGPVGGAVGGGGVAHRFQWRPAQWMSGRGWLPGESLKWFNLLRSRPADLQLGDLLHNVGTDRLEWRTATPGVATTTLLMVFAGGIQFLHRPIEHLQQVVRLGTLMPLLVWVNANSAVLLLGFELMPALKRPDESPGEVFRPSGTTKARLERTSKYFGAMKYLLGLALVLGMGAAKATPVRQVEDQRRRTGSRSIVKSPNAQNFTPLWSCSVSWKRTRIPIRPLEDDRKDKRVLVWKSSAT